MAALSTVRGDIDTTAVGACLMHEHVFILTPELSSDYPEITGWDEEAKVAEAIARLTALKVAGVDTIVDMTVLGMGRDIPRLQRINAAVDINIVVATGLYTFDKLPGYLSHVGPGGMVGTDREPMIDMFVRDVTQGIAGTGVKASVLKCCTDGPGVTPGVERVIRAVARAHRATGTPISTHADAFTRRGLEQQEILAQEGVDLSRVLIGHCGDTTDLDYLQALLDRGSFIGMDRFGLYGGRHMSFDERVGIVAELCARGYARQVVLSHDLACWQDWIPLELRPAAGMEQPDWHWLHITEKVVPALREQGVRDADITSMLTDNPRRVFETAGRAY